MQTAVSNTQLLCMVALLTITSSCKDEATSPDQALPTRELSLTAAAVTGTAPCDILFTGTFNAYADTLRLHVPDMFLMGGPGHTVIRYALPDTSVPPKRTYSHVQQFAAQGKFHMFMVLQTMTRDVFSDTLTISIN